MLHTVTFKDYGFDEFYRVYGEYKRNSTIRLLDREVAVKEFFHALVDFFIIYLVALNPRAYIGMDGRMASSSAFNIYFGLTLVTVFTIKTVTTSVTVKFAWTINMIILVLSLLVFFEDQNLIGLTMFFSTPSLIIFYVFAVITIFAKDQIIRHIVFNLGRKRKLVEFYNKVSERINLEEFDLPNQEFSLEELNEENQMIQKEVNSNKLKDINYSLRRT